MSLTRIEPTSTEPRTSEPGRFVIAAIPPKVLDRIRRAGRDAHGTPVEAVVAKGGPGEPLRCCLRNARQGEQMILFGYEPPLPPSPYREAGAVYAHAERCAGPDPGETYPAAWIGRPQVLRAYDSRGWSSTVRCTTARRLTRQSRRCSPIRES